jgi:hypothetical protein
MNLEELITSVALKVVEAYIQVAGQVLKCSHDKDLVDKVCEDMITSVRQRVRGTEPTFERGTPPSQMPARKCEPSA